MLDRVKTSLVYEKMKLNRDDGNNSFGDLMTGTMNRLGFTQIQSYLNDKLISIYPPYDTPEQQDAINTYLTWGLSEAGRIEFEHRYRHAIAGKGYLGFLAEYPFDVSDDNILAALKNQTYTSSGASLLYLVSGKKQR